MIRPKSRWHWRLFALAAAVAALPAFAADKPGQDASRRLQQQLRKVEQEKSQILQQKTELETHLKEAEKKAVEAGQRADLSAGRAARLGKELEAVKAEKQAQAAASKAELAALAARLAEAERRSAEQRMAHGAEKQQLEAAFARQKAVLSTCAERNVALHALGNELLEKYEQKSCLSSMLQAEPFTGLERARIENLVEAYRDKLDSQQFDPAASRVPPSH